MNHDFDHSPYPRTEPAGQELQSRIARYARNADRGLGALVVVLAIALAIGFLINDEALLIPWTLGLGLLLAFLIGISKFLPMLGAMLLSLPCGIGSSMVCDITNGPANEVLHPIHDKFWIVGLYALIRTVWLGIWS